MPFIVCFVSRYTFYAMPFVEKANRAMTVIKKVKNLFILVLFIVMLSL